MTLTFLKVKIVNPKRKKKNKVCKFLVDSGSVYSVVPKEELIHLGIKSTFIQEFILANGEVMKYPVGNILFEYKEKIVAAPVVFGEKDIFLLGATTIEALGMVLDPIRRELKPLPMLLM